MPSYRGAEFFKLIWEILDNELSALTYCKCYMASSEKNDN